MWMKSGQFRKHCWTSLNHLHSSLSRFFTFSKTSKGFPALQFSGYIVKIPHIVHKHLVNENSFARKTEETAFEEKGGVKNKPEYRGHHRNLAAKQRHYRVPSFHASSSSSSSSSSSLYQVRSNFRISLHSLQRIDQIYIKSIHIFRYEEREEEEREGERFIVYFMSLYYFTVKWFIHCKGLIKYTSNRFTFSVFPFVARITTNRVILDLMSTVMDIYNNHRA